MILSRLLGNLRSLKAISMGDSFGKKFVAGVMIVLLLSMFLGVPINIFWMIPILLVFAMIFLGAEFLRNRGASRNPFRILRGRGEFLCDDCKWNYGNVCTRPERPNATSCPEYKSK